MQESAGAKNKLPQKLLKAIMEIDKNAIMDYSDKHAVVNTDISSATIMVKKFAKCVSRVQFVLHATYVGANENLKSKLKEKFPDYTIILNTDGLSLLSEKAKIIGDYVTVKQFIAEQGESKMQRPFALVELSYDRLKNVVIASKQRTIVQHMLRSVNLQEECASIQIPISASAKVTKNMHGAVARYILKQNGKAVSNIPKSYVLFEYKFIENEKSNFGIEEMTASLNKRFPRFQIIIDAKKVCLRTTSDIALQVMEDTNLKTHAITITKALQQTVRYPTCSVVFEYLYV